MTDAEIKKIKLIVSDVDGVLTDGTIYYGTGQMEIKSFNIKDGLGIRLAKDAGLPIICLTGRSSEAVQRRTAELEVELYEGVSDKATALRAIAEAHKLELAEIAYLADDLNDLPAFRLVGFPVAVADAVMEIRAAAAYTTQAPGGHGAMRELIEYILRAQDRWDEAITKFLVSLGS